MSDFKLRLGSLKKTTIRDALTYIDFPFPKSGADLPAEYERAMVCQGFEEFLDRLDESMRKKTAKALGSKGHEKSDIMTTVHEIDIKQLFEKPDDDLIKHFCTTLNIGKEANTRQERTTELKDEITLIGGEALLKSLTVSIIKKHCADLELKVDGNKDKLATALHDHIFDLIAEEDGKEGKGDEEEVLNRSTDKKRKSDEIDDGDDKGKSRSKKQKTDDKEKEKEKEKKKKEQEKAKAKKEKEEKAKKEKARKEKEREKEREKEKKKSSSSSSKSNKKKDDSDSSSDSDSDSDSSSEEETRRRPGRPKKGSRTTASSSSSTSRSRSRSSSKSKSKSTSSKKKDKKVKEKKTPHKSPNINTIVKGKYTATDLHDKFYLGDLQEYCKENDLKATHLKKQRIIKAILDFHETGERPQEKAKKTKKGKKGAKKKSDSSKADDSSSPSPAPSSPGSKKRKEAPSPSPSRSSKKSRTDDSGSSGDDKSKSK